MQILQLLIILRAIEKLFDKFNDDSYLPQYVGFKVNKRITSSDEFVNFKEQMEEEVKAFQVSMSRLREGYMGLEFIYSH